MGDNLDKMRHSLSHILAQAVLKFYPKAKLAIGPAIDNGFYYDFDLGPSPRQARGKLSSGFSKSFTPEDLKNIQKEMKKIIKQDQKFEQFKVSVHKARALVKGNEYKLEMIRELAKVPRQARDDIEISFFRNINKKGEEVFVDMCSGPHVKSTGKVGAFKLDKIAGAYWKGEEKNKMLQRIYGLAFNTKPQLEKYLKMREEAEKRDHRKLGKELGLFMLDEEVGQGLPIWLPKGAMLCQVMEDFVIKTYIKSGYDLVRTPHISSERLFNVSGHLEYYKDDMYSPMDIDGEDYYVKPMNCPAQMKIYNYDLKSYRDLPIRYAELGTVYRYERSGTLHGLTRVRGFTQDDGHIICTPEQLLDELKRALELIEYVLKTFGFKKVETVLSVRDPKDKKKYLGKDKDWTFAEKSLKKALDQVGLKYEIEEGEAVFYGPKIDFKVTDAIGRKWQLSTLQMDFNLPERFKMTYVDKNGKEKTPYMLHRALLGSLERFAGVLIEHYAGAFPVWLAPVQVKVIPVGESHFDKAEEIAEQLRENDIRCEVDLLSETVSYKIRKAEKEKAPLIIVIGDKEIEKSTVNVRERGKEKQVEMLVDDFIKKVLDKVEKKL